MPPVVIAAGVAAAGAIAGGAIASHGASKAAQAQTQAAEQANQTQLQIFNQQRADAAPWRQMGLQALGRLGQLYGFGSTAGTTPVASAANNNQLFSGIGLTSGLLANLSPQQLAQLRQQFPNLQLPTTAQAIPAQPPLSQQQQTMNWLAMDPGYQFRLKEGENALNSGWAAKGMLRSGAAAKAFQEYGQNYASNEFGNAYNRLSALAGIGQTVNQSNNALAQNYANNVSQNQLASGQARASSYAANGQMWGNTVGQLAGFAGSVIGQSGGGYNPGWSPNTAGYNYQGQY